MMGAGKLRSNDSEPHNEDLRLKGLKLLGALVVVFFEEKVCIIFNRLCEG